jgi:hypothetical protein
MQKNVIERDISIVGKSTPERLCAPSQPLFGALKQVGPDVHWVTDHKLYWICLASGETASREHARISGSSVIKISPVRSTIDLISAE